MRSGRAFGAALAALLLCAEPAVALQSVILPQPDDGTTSQNPDARIQNRYSTDQSDTAKTNSLGSFHFGVTSGSEWPGDPGRFYRPQTSTPDAYGSASVPGSEFNTSGNPFPR